MSTTTPNSKRTLLTGASGYLGQHLLSHWMTHGLQDGEVSSISHEIVALYHRREGFAAAVQSAPCHPNVRVIPRQCDVTNPDEIQSLMEEYSTASPSPSPSSPPFEVCIHAAAMSSPRACQENPGRARDNNIPAAFFEAVLGKKIQQLVLLSTDQVYDGRKDVLQQGLYKEDIDAPNPLNIYGETKRDMESYLRNCYRSNESVSTTTRILRSSIILGPKAPFDVGAHDTFLHFCASRDGQETTFFTNEYRTVVSVGHVCRTLDWMILHSENDEDGLCQVYHLGGPFRVNRYDMAQAVFRHFGYNSKGVLIPTSQTSPTSPLDISMDTRKLETLTGIIHEPATLERMVQATFGAGLQNESDG